MEQSKRQEQRQSAHLKNQQATLDLEELNQKREQVLQQENNSVASSTISRAERIGKPSLLN